MSNLSAFYHKAEQNAGQDVMSHSCIVIMQSKMLVEM